MINKLENTCVYVTWKTLVFLT